VNPEEITAQIMDAWDEIAPSEGDTPGGQPEPEVEETPAGEPEIGDTEGDTDEEEPEVEAEEPEEGDEEDEADEEGGDEEEAPAPSGFIPDDPELAAFLTKFQGDVSKALRYGLQSQQALSRMNERERALLQRAQDLEVQLSEANAFAGGGVLLSEEQRSWVGEAIESGNPVMYVREAVRAQEFDLARAVCAAWGDHAPFEALRAAGMVDQAEAYSASNTVQAQPIDHSELLGVLSQHFPDLPEYAEQMKQTIDGLGDNHPLVIEARSNDPQQAVRGVIGIYEIARASTRATASTREQIKNGNREKAQSARKAAVVSSGGASPSPSETPRSNIRLGPGLTLEQLDEEWARHA